jgi:hypothetical protein
VRSSELALFWTKGGWRESSAGRERAFWGVPAGQAGTLGTLGTLNSLLLSLSLFSYLPCPPSYLPP